MTLMIGQIGFTSMKVEDTQENVALSVSMMTLAISMLMSMDTVYMEDGHIQETRLFHGLTMFQSITKKVCLKTNMQVHVRCQLLFFLGNNPDATIITDNFVDAIGNKDHATIVSHMDTWYMGMYGHWSDVPTEELCAWRCLSSKLERCMFYFWGHGHCQLGNYINSGNSRTGHFDANTKYKVLKAIGMYHSIFG